MRQYRWIGELLLRRSIGQSYWQLGYPSKADGHVPAPRGAPERLDSAFGICSVVNRYRLA
jgi:hypothetical protein